MRLMAEQGGLAVLVGEGLRLGELLQGLVDDGVEAFHPAGHGAFQAAGDDGGERVVFHGFEDAGGDERSGVGGAEGEARAGLVAVTIFQEFKKHGKSLGGERMD